MRRIPFSISEIDALQASFKRARSVVVPTAESTAYTLSFGRLRTMVDTLIAKAREASTVTLPADGATAVVMPDDA